MLELHTLKRKKYRRTTRRSSKIKEIFGHWELDTVVGKLKTKSALMVMTERSKGIEIIRKIESKKSRVYCS